MDEFALIRRYFQPLQQRQKGACDGSVSVGIGDDCAVLNVPEGQQLVVSIDTLVEGTHANRDLDGLGVRPASTAALSKSAGGG